MNRQIIESNIREAREQLEKIEKSVAAGKRLSEGEFLVMIQHAYHHLNFAWNARNVSTSRYSKLSDKEFNEWGRYPAADIEEFELIGGVHAGE